jgi:hypothetical protein
LADYYPFLTPDAAVIYPSRGKLLLLVLGAAAFVALGFFVWSIGEIKGQVAGALSIVFFSACFVFGVIRLIWRSPSLIISPMGIFEGSSALGSYILRWDEIHSVYISTMRVTVFSSQRFLSVRLKNTEEFLARQSSAKARIMRMNMGLVGAPINISASALPVTLEEILELIHQKSPAGLAPSSQ